MLYADKIMAMGKFLKFVCIKFCDSKKGKFVANARMQRLILLSVAGSGRV